MITVTQAQLWTWIATFLWPFARIAGCVMVAPGFGAVFVPRRTRLVVAFALALLVAPFVTAPVAIEPLSIVGLLALVIEVLIGIACGFLLQLVFDAVGLAGQLLANAMGLSFAFNVDPARGASTPAVGQLHLVFVTLTFLALDGHIAIVRALVGTFSALPIATTSGLEVISRTVVAAGGLLIVDALRIALPGLAALLCANFAFGFVSRAAPSLNVVSVGLPLALLFGILVLQFALAGVQSGFATAFGVALQTVSGWR
ncbi:MAG: flagellar biosynthetic protein FliR [Gammaproteobacteria bacterium]|nr:flagellar biosynthetic protein FliR [Gammaproteobacteria bacterium]